MTVEVESDLPITDGTFGAKFETFRVEDAGGDTVSIHHRFFLPELGERDLGREVYRKPPWAIYRRDGSWVYLGIPPHPDGPGFYRAAFFTGDHSRGVIHNDALRRDQFEKGGLEALTLFPSDQVLLARVMADRRACYLHAAGMVLDGKGFLFVGHSEAGKSTTVTMLRDLGEILCDDRVIVRRWPDGLRIHGTWSHGDVPQVSAACAPLRAVLFLEKAGENRLVPMDGREVVRRLPLFVIKPLVTADWWEKVLALIGTVAREAPAYRMRFDRSGRIASAIKEL